MPRVRITHTTEYTYRRPVHPTTHRLMLRPRDSHDLRLREATLTLTPPAARTRWAHDVFGNSVCYVDWDDARTDVLRIVSTLDLDHFPATSDLPLAPAAETYPFSYPPEEAPDLARVLERHYPDPDRVVDEWARGFVRGDGRTRTMDMLSAMAQAIKSDFGYEVREEEGTHPPSHTLTTRRGACRDFALLMMEAARSLGMAARFVSGYLYDDRVEGSADPVIGGGATHAWCAIYLPGAGWVEFDPTNGLIAGRDLIRVCAARTPQQAVPVGGAYKGRPEDFIGLHVHVEVTVGDDPASAPGAAGEGARPPALETAPPDSAAPPA